MEFLHMPLIRQAYDYTCGPACLASVLCHWNVWDGCESDLYPMLGTTDQGTRPQDLARVAAQEFDLSAFWVSDLSIADLKKHWEDGATLILGIQAWSDDAETDPVDYTDHWDDGHYVVFEGMDDADVWFMDPSIPGRYGVLSHDELLRRWHDHDDVRHHHSAVVIMGTHPTAPREPLRIG